MEISFKILQMVTDFLHVTQTPDESTRRRLENEIADGIAYIRDVCDPGATCEPGTEYADLLKEYVLRAESGARDTFAADFSGELLSGNLRKTVGDYAAAMGYGDA